MDYLNKTLAKDELMMTDVEKYETSIFLLYEKIVDSKRNIKIDWPIPKGIKLKPVMSDEELKGFLSFMNPKYTYFEFGCGGSTTVASYYGLKTYSYESDKVWYEKIKNLNLNINLTLVDFGSQNWGNPRQGTTVNDWKKYVQAYKKEYNADIILIDGRFRVACAIDVYDKIKKDTIVLVHDYTVRPEYHIIEKYYNLIKTFGTLAVFLKKEKLVLKDENTFENYLIDPRI